MGRRQVRELCGWGYCCDWKSFEFCQLILNKNAIGKEVRISLFYSELPRAWSRTIPYSDADLAIINDADTARLGPS